MTAFKCFTFKYKLTRSNAYLSHSSKFVLHRNDSFEGISYILSELLPFHVEKNSQRSLMLLYILYVRQQYLIISFLFLLIVSSVTLRCLSLLAGLHVGSNNETLLTCCALCLYLYHLCELNNTLLLLTICVMQANCVDISKKDKRVTRRWRTKSVSKDTKIQLQVQILLFPSFMFLYTFRVRLCISVLGHQIEKAV